MCKIAAEQGWHRVMFSDIIGKSVALHRVACSSKGDAPKWVMDSSDTLQWHKQSFCGRALDLIGASRGSYQHALANTPSGAGQPSSLLAKNESDIG